jgi:hypothetical protein
LLGRQAEDWVNAIDPAGDLDSLRAQIVERILQLYRQEDK